MGNKIVKIRYFPIWQISNLENWLEYMENNRFRLVQIKCGIIFIFEKSKVKKTLYFYTLNSNRGSSMSTWFYSIKTNYNGIEIDTSFSCFSVFYICNHNEDELIFLKEARKSFIIEFYTKILLCNILLLVLSFLSLSTFFNYC